MRDAGAILRDALQLFYLGARPIVRLRRRSSSENGIEEGVQLVGVDPPVILDHGGCRIEEHGCPSAFGGEMVDRGPSSRVGPGADIFRLEETGIAELRAYGEDRRAVACYVLPHIAEDAAVVAKDVAEYRGGVAGAQDVSVCFHGGGDALSGFMAIVLHGTRVQICPV